MLGRKLGSLASAFALFATTLIAVLGGSAQPAAAVDPVGTVTNIPTANILGPEGITTGPDGNLWFTNASGASIGRLTPTGALSEFPVEVNAPGGITRGPDGNLWFIGQHNVGRITTDGDVTLFPDPFVACCSSRIAAGPDGALWYTPGSIGAHGIGRITTDGTVSLLSSGSVLTTQGITAGPDGAMWYTNDRSGDIGSIGRITTAGATSIFSHASIRDPGAITTGPDGNLWFTEPSSIGRITPAGIVSNFTHPSISNAREITTGPDGALWFTHGDNRVGRITVAGVITNVTVPTISSPRGITTGPDGNLWIASTGNDSVSRLTTTGGATKFTGNGIGRPEAIAAGANGDLWFTDSTRNAIGRMTPAGTFTSQPLSPRTVTLPPLGTFGLAANPRYITAGNGGQLFFTQDGSRIQSEAYLLGYAGVGRIMPNGTVVPDVSDAHASPNGIAVDGAGNPWWTHDSDCTIGAGCQDPAVVGPPGEITGPEINSPRAISAGGDGNMWFVDGLGDVERIGRLTPSGVVTMFTDPDLDNAFNLAKGDDGNVWFTTTDDRVGRITPGGAVTTYTDPSISAPQQIVTGPDGNLWFTNRENDSIGRITTNGVVTYYTGVGISEPTAITAGRDGGVWFINSGNKSFGRIQALLSNAATMAYPANGTAVNGGTFLAASAGPGVNAVEFRATGGPLNDAVVSAGSLTIYGWFGGWSTASLPQGNYQIVAVGTDANGNRGRSAPITITVDHTPPTAQMLVPDPGATLRGTAVLDAGAADNVGVASVEFRLNGNGQTNRLVGTGTLTYWGWITTWNTASVADGTYNLRARATDRAGIVGTSAPISIRVDN